MTQAGRPPRPDILSNALRRGRRKLGEILSSSRLDLVYSRRYQLHLPGGAYDPLRGERILGFLETAGLLGEVHAPEPVPFRLVRRVHADDYLESLNRPGALLRMVGWEVTDDQADRFLESQRTMVAGTVLAAHLALDSGGVAANLGGGFHHAFADRGERFCALNDLAVAVADLRWRGAEEKVLIVDLDVHDGDGTRSLFAADPTVHTFSIHNRTNPDAAPDAVESTIVELGGGVEDAAYLEALQSHLPPVMERFKPDLVFYLAGCDPATGDEIGDWNISAEGMLARDRFVESCVRGSRSGGRRRNLPLVILLAGGYGLDAWRYSARFLSALANRGKPLEPPTTEEALLMRYRSLARGYGERELTGEPSAEHAPPASSVDDWGLTEEDVGAAVGAHRRPSRLLGYYSRQGMELALERTGFLDRLRAKGFDRPLLEFDLDNPTGDTVRVFAGPSRNDLLIELRMRIDRREMPDFALLRIEWLLLQNPRQEFTPERPPLPGQKHPGLGMLHETIAMLILACDRLQLDGVVFVPAHFHVAIQGRRQLRFLKPADEARFRALEIALQGLPLPEATRAVEQGKVVEAATGEPFRWEPAAMVLPVSEPLSRRMLGEEYEKEVLEAGRGHALVVRGG